MFVFLFVEFQSDKQLLRNFNFDIEFCWFWLKFFALRKCIFNFHSVLWLINVRPLNMHFFFFFKKCIWKCKIIIKFSCKYIINEWNQTAERRKINMEMYAWMENALVFVAIHFWNWLKNKRIDVVRNAFLMWVRKYIWKIDMRKSYLHMIQNNMNIAQLEVACFISRRSITQTREMSYHYRDKNKKKTNNNNWNNIHLTKITHIREREILF